jgi:hypothetical protein
LADCACNALDTNKSANPTKQADLGIDGILVDMISPDSFVQVSHNEMRLDCATRGDGINKCFAERISFEKRVG